MTNNTAQSPLTHTQHIASLLLANQILHRQFGLTIDQHQDNWTAAAQRIFDAEIGLQQAIEEDVLPTLATLDCGDSAGSAFFLTPELLVTNAHVSRTDAHFKQATLSTLHHQQPQSLQQQTVASFIRPLTNSPDIATHLVNISGASCLPQWSVEDECIDDKITFYIDQFAPAGQQFKRLKPLANDANSLNRQYQSIDHKQPNPGASGSPVFTAKLVRINQKTQWCFTIDAVLYAKDDTTPLVHAVSIHQEIDLILEHFNACDPHTTPSLQSHLPQRHYEQSKHDNSHYKQPNNDITLLWYNYMVAISRSLLLPKNRTRAMTERLKAADIKTNITIGELREDFNALLKSIGQDEVIPFPSSRKPTTLYQSTYFRLDFQGKQAEFSIEDNLKDKNGSPIKVNDRTLSSVFAKVINRHFSPETENMGEIRGPVLKGALKLSAHTKVDPNNPELRAARVLFPQSNTHSGQQNNTDQKKKKAKKTGKKKDQRVSAKKCAQRAKAQEKRKLPHLAITGYERFANYSPDGHVSDMANPPSPHQLPSP